MPLSPPQIKEKLLKGIDEETNVSAFHQLYHVFEVLVSDKRTMHELLMAVRDGD